MTLQARFSQSDPRLYSPDRDVAHAFKPMVLLVAERIEKQSWPVVADVLAHYGVTHEQMGQTCQAFCTFVMAATERRETMEECLMRSGWFDQPEVAQLAYMALLGTVVSGYFFAGAREACCTGHDPVLTGDDLRDHGLRCTQAMTLPRWRRGLAKLWLRIKESFNTLRGKR